MAIPKTNPSHGTKEQLEYVWNNRILVVDDEREIAASYKDILSPPANVIPMRSSRSQTPVTKSTKPTFDFEVVVAHSAEEALTLVRTAHHQGKQFAMGFFDVVLSGSKMDGFELVREIHKIQPDIYSVFVTAYNDRSVDSIHNLLGEDKADRWDYLNKPFTEGEILQKARNFVSLYNLQREMQVRDKQLAELHRSLLESERMTSVAAVARGVGHEFGNILMQIMGIADVNSGKDAQAMQTALNKILDASTRASQILDRFKNLAAPLDHSSSKENAFIDDVLDEALSLMEHQFKNQNIKICHIKRDHVSLPVNTTSLVQVFINLIINSLHAMGNSGQIDFSIQDLGKYVEIRVRDYGPGVEPSLLEKIMEPFFTTKGEKGTGLGLAICREIVEIEHKGELIVQNHGVKGLETVIRLPRGEAIQQGA